MTDAGRRASDEVIRGLDTTSERIRALAKAGYDRVEIGKILSIRYQHVRKVLVDAGVTGGLRRGTRSAQEPAISPPVALAHEAASWEVLLRAGFRFIGEWTLAEEGVIKLDATVPKEPGVYAFTVGDAVHYVGVTHNGLRARLEGYRIGYEGQRTNARVKGLITTVLAAGARVKVMVATPPDLSWDGLSVNTAAGLEAGLIHTIRPPWNIMGAT